MPKVQDNKEFAKELEKPTREFAVRIIRLSRSLPIMKSVENCLLFLPLLERKSELKFGVPKVPKIMDYDFSSF